VVLDSPPYELGNSLSGYSITACLVLRPGFMWTSPIAQPLPKTKDKRVMSLFLPDEVELNLCEHIVSLGVQKVFFEM
jgi:hypothetical protein